MPEPGRSILDNYEKLAKILSLVAVPVLLGIGGWALQDALSKRNVDQQYVSLALSILKEPKSDELLRTWAVELLNEHSPVPIPSQTQAKLKTGEISFAAFASYKRLTDLYEIIIDTKNMLEIVMAEYDPNVEERRALDTLLLELSGSGARTDAKIQAILSGRQPAAITEAEAILLPSLQREIEGMAVRAPSIATVRELAERVLNRL